MNAGEISKVFESKRLEGDNTTGKRYKRTQYYFGCSIMSCRDNVGVIIFIEGGRSKIDEPNVGIFENFRLDGFVLLNRDQRRVSNMLCASRRKTNRMVYKEHRTAYFIRHFSTSC